ncbi:hypothetical protein ACFV24_02835 [Nocardia fluminea]|uniref:hypothetical protein n=2 Tax=Nocardia TaxID=1817 RepID=UPI00366BE032
MTARSDGCMREVLYRPDEPSRVIAPNYQSAVDSLTPDFVANPQAGGSARARPTRQQGGGVEFTPR